MIGYIYTLHGKLETDIFYVGSTINPIIREFSHKNFINRSIVGCNPTLLIIDEIEFTDKKDLLKLEMLWIHQVHCWGFNLINYNLGYGFNVRRIMWLATSGFL